MQLDTEDSPSVLRTGIHWTVAILIAITVSAFGAAHARSSDGTQELRVSLDTGPNHLRSRVLREFAERLDAEMPGRFRLRLFDSGQLYSDRDVIKALMWGDVDMAMPIPPYVARFEPAANATSLPMFYGQPPEIMQQVLDGPLNTALARRIEARLPVKVLSPSLDLGYAQVFSTDRPLRKSEDLRGLKIRVPSGGASIRMFRLQGANPVAIPWPDVPLGLSQGNIDAVATTFETLYSGALWDVGVRFALVERRMFLEYMPLIRREYWETLDADTRERFLAVWRETMRHARVLAEQYQSRAERIAIGHGIEVHSIPEAEVEIERARLLRHQADLVMQLRLPDDIVQVAQDALDHAHRKVTVE